MKLVLLKGIDSANSESLIAELEKVTSQPDLKTSKNECLSLNELRDICDQAYAAFQKSDASISRNGLLNFTRVLPNRAGIS